MQRHLNKVEMTGGKHLNAWELLIYYANQSGILPALSYEVVACFKHKT